MSYDDRQGGGRYPPQGPPPNQDYPPRDPRREPPYEDPYSGQGPGSGLRPPRAPDLRRKTESYREIEQHQRSGYDYDDRDPEDEPDNGSSPRGCFGVPGMDRMDWVFMGLLFFAAMRGGSDRGGCLPSRACLRTVLLNLGGVALLIGSIFVFAETEQDGLATIMLGSGALICLFGAGSVLFLVWATMRLIDFDGGEGLERSGFIGNLLGR
ncbi:MAG: hypothetical protein GYB66_11900 [Chloroflexi bacterium]|nr:hypothetical protein [Chloroflexota bacterium]